MNNKINGTILLAIILAIVLLIVDVFFVGIQIGKRSQVNVWVEPPLTEITPRPTDVVSKVTPTIKPQKINQSDTLKWSNTRKTVWERKDLGLKITTPEWIESRYPTKVENGRFLEYSKWTKIYPSSETENGTFVFVSGLQFGGINLTILDSKYTGKSFKEVAEESLIGANFCAIDWKNSPSGCTSPLYCYTKDEVVNNLTLYKSSMFGPYEGQMRIVNEEFDKKNDCRGEFVWLIKAKDGQFVSSTIDPDSETIRLEAI